MICAIIVAGGSGSRMNAAVKKQYLCLEGVPVVGHTLKSFDRYPGLDRIVLVVPEIDRDRCRSDILAPLGLDHDVLLVSGGPRRQDSVMNGLAVAGDSGDTVMIHDGVRPFVRKSLIDACLSGVKATGACIPAIAVTDTLKQVDEKGAITATLDRRFIQLAQTPQTFSLGLIRRAHQLAAQRGFSATDDASVAEFAGERVMIVPGDRDNIKITTPPDLPMARSILDQWQQRTSL